MWKCYHSDIVALSQGDQRWAQAEADCQEQGGLVTQIVAHLDDLCI